MTEDVYRELQQHLDGLPVGFPPTESGVEIRILKHIFTPEEAKIASQLKFAWNDLEPLESIYERTKSLGYTIEELEQHLDNMVSKGAIKVTFEGEKRTYGAAMLLIGFYEFQVNKLTKEFVEDFYEYLEEWVLEYSKLGILQTRLVPVGVTVDHEATIAKYDDIKKVMEIVDGPFMRTNCICRQSKELLGTPCKASSRLDVCMAFGKTAQTYINMGWGKEITRAEALALLKENEEDGLIFQAENTQKADFVCSCCSCCCQAIAYINKFDDPGMLVNSNYYAEIDPDKCTGCETCIDRCQMAALTLESNVPLINRKRCIGCGNCVVVCPSEAIKLQAKHKQNIPRMTSEDLYNDIAKKKARIKARELKKQQRLEKKKEKKI